MPAEGKAIQLGGQMSMLNCCECGEEKHVNELFNIPIFKDSLHWCFDCANKQLALVPFEIVKLTKKQAEKKYKTLRFKTSRGYVSFKVRQPKVKG